MTSRVLSLRTLCLVPLLAASSACGTTVPLSQQGAAGDQALRGGIGDTAKTGAATPSSTTGGGGSLGTTGSRRVGTSSGATSGSAGSGDTSSTVAGGSTTSVSPVPPKGRGWDQRYVYVGVTTQKDTQQAFSSVGFSGIDPGDTEAQANAVIAGINARGGLLGRQVKPVFKDVPLIASASNPDDFAQQVCTYYSQDVPVVALINIVLTMDTENFRACFAKARVPLFNVELTATDQALQSQLRGYLYTTIVPTWDAFAPAFVARLQSLGYFHGWDVRLQRVTGGKPKVGVLVLDNPLGTRIAKTIVAALKRHGYADAVTYAYAYPGNQIQGAVNYFQGNNVTHVISSDIELLTFQQYAGTQQYFPRYGVNTNNQISQMAPISGNKSQVGAVGVGWAPAWDVLQAQDPGVWSRGEKACLDAMRKGQVRNSSRLAVAFALDVCDGLELFARGALAGKGLSASAIRSGIDAVGPTFSPAGSFASGIRSGRSFLPGGFRNIAWNQSCTCYEYTSRQTVAF